MELCTGQYRYLLSIYRLTMEKRRIRCVDIANDLGVTRPSVSKMMKCMVRMELVHPDYCEAVRLTEKGRQIAESYNDDFEMVYLYVSAHFFQVGFQVLAHVSFHWERVRVKRVGYGNAYSSIAYIKAQKSFHEYILPYFV